MKIYVVSNDEKEIIYTAKKTCAAARQFVEDKLLDEKADEISKILLSNDSRNEKKKRIRQLEGFYENTLNRFESSYNFWYANQEVECFGVDEYNVSEVNLED